MGQVTTYTVESLVGESYLVEKCYSDAMENAAAGMSRVDNHADLLPTFPQLESADIMALVDEAITDTPE